VDKTVTVCRHCGRGLHWDWVPLGKGLAGAGGLNFAVGGSGRLKKNTAGSGCSLETGCQ